MIRHFLFAISFMIACLLFAAPSQAITIKVDGFVSQVDPVFSSLVSLGDQMKATFSFDPNEISRTYDLAQNRKFHYLPSLNYEMWFGDIYVSGAGGRAEVTNDYTDSSGRFWDRFILEWGGAGVIASPLLADNFDVNVLSASMTFYDFIEAAAITSSNMPTEINAEMFDRISTSIQMEIAGGEFDWLPMFSRVTHIEVINSPIPEPSTILLLGSGLLGLGWYGRKRKKS